MLARWLTRVMDAQTGWTGPLGDAAQRFLHRLLGRATWLRDLLNGRWLGHPLHGASTDLPIGILLMVSVFDVLDMPDVAVITLVVGVVAMSLSALSGLTDFSDTDGKARSRATLHATLMVVALVGYLVSLVLRLSGGPGPATAAGWVAAASFLVLLAGAYVGGDVVYVLGNMVSRHAFRGAGKKWIALEPAEVDGDGEIPEGRPIKAKLGINQLVLVREGDRILALHDACAHAGGPLHEGTLSDGHIECPWHGSRYEMASGHVRRGPSVYDQPAYEVRRREGGGWEARRQAG